MSGEQIRLQESTAGSRRWSGSEFQTVGPTTENAWVSIPKGATTNSRTTNSRGTDSWWHLANRRCWRPGTSEYGTHSPRYLGAEDNDGLSQQTCCLHCTRWGITSQCRSSCISRDRQRESEPIGQMKPVANSYRRRRRYIAPWRKRSMAFLQKSATPIDFLCL